MSVLLSIYVNEAFMAELIKYKLLFFNALG